MADLVYVDEQEAQANKVLRSAVASEQFTQQQVVSVMPESTLDGTIELILEHQCKVLITDYRLSDHKADVQFSGADLVREIRSRFAHFPCFVTTSFPGEAIDEPLDTNMIFPKSDFLDRAEKEADELPFFLRVKKKVAEYERYVDESKAEFEDLCRRALGIALTQEESQRLLDLDSTLESIYGAQHSIDDHIKQKALEPFGRLIEKTEALIDQIETELSGKSSKQ